VYGGNIKNMPEHLIKYYKEALKNPKFQLTTKKKHNNASERKVAKATGNNI
jgi:hypothetical protein